MTLLEVMVAAGLLAVFFVGIFAIVWNTIVTRQVIEDKAVPFATGPIVMKQIVQDLESFQAAAFEGTKDVFKGSAARPDDVRLDFVVAVPARQQVLVKDELVRASVNEVGYRLHRSEAESDQFALYRREDMGVDSEPSEGGKYYKLCDRVRRFAIDYYDEDPGTPGTDQAEGTPDWDARKESKMPWGCRITLVLAGTPGIEEEDENRPPRDFVFQTFVAFRTRFEKPDGAKKPGQ